MFTWQWNLSAVRWGASGIYTVAYIDIKQSHPCPKECWVSEFACFGMSWNVVAMYNIFYQLQHLGISLQTSSNAYATSPHQPESFIPNGRSSKAHPNTRICRNKLNHEPRVTVQRNHILQRVGHPFTYLYSIKTQQ